MIERLRQRLSRLPAQTSMTLAQLRDRYDRAQFAFPVGDAVDVEAVDTRAVRGEWLTPMGAGDAVPLYLHGGGYVVGSLLAHHHLVAGIASAAGTRAFSLAYRLALPNTRIRRRSTTPLPPTAGCLTPSRYRRGAS